MAIFFSSTHPPPPHLEGFHPPNSGGGGGGGGVGAKVLGKLSVPGCPTNLDNSGTWAYCTCSRCGRGLFGHFLSFIFMSPLYPSLGDGLI